MWEKSRDTLNVPEFLEKYLSDVEALLNDAIPVYASLHDKDELTSQEEWILKFLQDTFKELYGRISMLVNVFFSANLDIPKDLKGRANNLLSFLGDITGLFPEKDKELQEAIEEGLKDSQEGRVLSLEEFLSKE